jgi:hypothetical protein
MVEQLFWKGDELSVMKRSRIVEGSRALNRRSDALIYLIQSLAIFMLLCGIFDITQRCNIFGRMLSVSTSTM